jgi:hypothetical protein
MSAKSSPRSILTIVGLLFMCLLYPTCGLFRCLTLRPVVLLPLKHHFTLYAKTFCLIVRDFLRHLGHRSDAGFKAGKKVEIWGHWVRPLTISKLLPARSSVLGDAVRPASLQRRLSNGDQLNCLPRSWHIQIRVLVRASIPFSALDIDMRKVSECFVVCQHASSCNRRDGLLLLH